MKSYFSESLLINALKFYVFKHTTPYFSNENPTVLSNTFSFLFSEWSEEGYEEPSHFTQCLMSIYHNETVSFDVADDDILPSW